MCAISWGRYVIVVSSLPLLGAVLVERSKSPDPDAKRDPDDELLRDSLQPGDGIECRTSASRSDGPYYMEPSPDAERDQRLDGGPSPWGSVFTEDMKQYTPSNEAEIQWTEQKPPPSLAGTKLAVLMFVADGILHPQLWSDWLAHAKQTGHSVAFHIHAYRGPESFKTEGFQQYVHPQTARTRFCDMWEAEMLMLSVALRDAEVSHLVIVSADSVPVKSVAWMYKELAKDPSTRMCVEVPNSVPEGGWPHPPFIPKHHKVPSRSWPGPVIRAETWWLMRRADATLFTSNADLINSTFYQTCKGCCTEEAMWAHPLVLRHNQWLAEAPFIDECVMYTNWTYKKSWGNHRNMCDCPNLKTAPRDPFCRWSYHPATYYKVSAAAFSELQQSSFWFARKFRSGSLDTASPRW